MAITRAAKTGLPIPDAYEPDYHVPMNDWLAALDASAGLGPLAVAPAAPGTTTLLPSGSLNVKVAAGRYRRPSGIIASYAGSGSLAIPASSTRKVYLDQSGALAHDAAWPDAPHVPLATVTTDGTAVTAITDERLAWGHAGPPGRIYTGTADSAAVANSVADLSLMPSAFLGSPSILAADLIAGTTLKLSGWIVASSTGTPTFSITLTMAPLPVLEVGLDASGWSSQVVAFEAVVTVRAVDGSAGAIAGMLSISAAGETAEDADSASAVNTAGPLSFGLTGRWSAADPANTATLKGMLASISA